MAALAYKLVCEVTGHDSDVRSVCVLENGVIASGSRDASVRLWAPHAGNTYELQKTLYGHEHFVAVVIALPASAQNPQGTIASGFFFECSLLTLLLGGHDKKIIIWDLETGSAALVLTGHTNTVSSLSLASNGDIVSGSWDKTVRVWRNGACVATFEGHSEAVWGVLAVPGGSDILSASADKTIRLWRGGQTAHVFRGHTDAVRSLVAVPGIGFASASNDGSVRMWTLDGQALEEMAGHSAYVYSLALSLPDMHDSLTDMSLISGGEDKTVRVWKGQENVQTIPHPAVVWSVAVAPHTGEIVVGCSDHVIRVWSQIPSRQAAQEVVDKFNQQVQAQAIPKATVGSVDPKTLPGPEWLLENTGKKDGENKMIREGSSAAVYMWSASASKWEKIGTVVDSAGGGTIGEGGPSASGKAMLHGKEYDFVFNVDTEDGVVRKLGYNIGENPYEVAQQFIFDQEISQSFLDNIARFIIDNTAGAAPQSNYVDAPVIDPFSGAAIGVYPSDRRSAPAPASKPAPKPAPSLVPSAALAASGPNRAYLEFGNVAQQLPPVHNKLKELARREGPTVLSKEETEQLENIIRLVQDTAHYSSSRFQDKDFALLLKLLTWPAADLFPVFDLLRFLWLHPSASDYLCEPSRLQSPHSNVLALILQNLKGGDHLRQITALRNVANCFLRPRPREALIAAHTESLFDLLPDLTKSTHKLVRFSAVTVLLNFSVYFLEKPNPEKKIQSLSMLAELLAAESDPETAFRALTTVQTLIWHDESTKALAGDLEVKAAAQKFAKSEVEKVRQAAQALVSAL